MDGAPNALWDAPPPSLPSTGEGVRGVDTGEAPAGGERGRAAAVRRHCLREAMTTAKAAASDNANTSRLGVWVRHNPI